MKNYLLLYAFVCIAFSSAMDNAVTETANVLSVSFIVVPNEGSQERHVCSEKCLQFAHNAVNASVLGVDVNSWFSGAKATYASAWEQRQHAGDSKRALKHLKTICDDIPGCCQSESFFEKLQIKNAHAVYLFNTLINHRVAQLKEVTGSILDDMLDREKTIPGLSPAMSRFIYSSAQKQYEQEMFLDKPMPEIPFDEAKEEIHFTSLTSWKAGQVDTVSIVGNGKYVKGLSFHFRGVFWDVINGNILDEEIEDFSNYPFCSKNSHVFTNNCLVVYGLDTKLPSASKTLTTFKELRRSSLDESVVVPTVKLSEILLFQRPTFTSSLCKRAFENSKNVEELKTLQDCSTIKTLQGFPASNLAEKIKSKIEDMNATRYLVLENFERYSKS